MAKIVELNITMSHVSRSGRTGEGVSKNESLVLEYLHDNELKVKPKALVTVFILDHLRSYVNIMYNAINDHRQMSLTASMAKVIELKIAVSQLSWRRWGGTQEWEFGSEVQYPNDIELKLKALVTI